jgi:hypothetical protein
MTSSSYPPTCHWLVLNLIGPMPHRIPWVMGPRKRGLPAPCFAGKSPNKLQLLFPFLGVSFFSSGTSADVQLPTMFVSHISDAIIKHVIWDTIPDTIPIQLLYLFDYCWLYPISHIPSPEHCVTFFSPLDLIWIYPSTPYLGPFH